MQDNKFIYRTVLITCCALVLAASGVAGVLVAPVFFLINMVIIGLLEANDQKALDAPAPKFLTAGLSHSPLVYTVPVKKVITCSAGCCQYEI